jgi:3-deoxy-7-phosphoheptulonate synthase
MLITLNRDADVASVQAALQGLGLWTEPAASARGGPACLLVAPFSARVEPRDLARVPGVADVHLPAERHPLLAERRGRPVRAGPVAIGDGSVVLMAGPCSVESREQIDTVAALVARAGARLLRGGAYKPRSSPYAFAGHGEVALGWLAEAARRHGLGVVTELLSEHDVARVAAHADLLQIGSRNMQNYALLRAAGKADKPLLLKRGMAARLDDWLGSAEHALAAGAPGVVFCERGIVGFDPSTRNLLDLGAVALLRHVHGQPVIVDPSHAAGRRDLIPALARAAVASGADGLLLEVHPAPEQARSDGPQALDAVAFASLATYILRGRTA